MTKPHASSLRNGRVSLPGQVYLVTTVTYQRAALRKSLYGENRHRPMRYHAEKGNVESLAFVVMPDHLHWLLALTGKLNLSELMRSVKLFFPWHPLLSRQECRSYRFSPRT